MADDTLPYWDVGKVGCCELCCILFLFYYIINIYSIINVLYSLSVLLVCFRFISIYIYLRIILLISRVLYLYFI